MQTLATYLLIALLRTNEEGGAVQYETATLDQCQTLGRTINDQFESIRLGDSGRHPSVIWTCVALPAE